MLTLNLVSFLLSLLSLMRAEGICFFTLAIMSSANNFICSFLFLSYCTGYDFQYNFEYTCALFTLTILF
jgi:hypothetical protein